MRQVPFLLVGIAVASATPLAQTPANPSFEVASVRPNTGSDGSIPVEPNPPDGIRLVNYPLESIIRYAYGVQPFRVVGLPGWTHSERFDIAAKAASPITEPERTGMMRSLLADRFKVGSLRVTRTDGLCAAERAGRQCVGIGSHATSRLRHEALLRERKR